MPLKLVFQLCKNLPQPCAGNSCWDNYVWWPLSPFLNYLFSRQKFVQSALWVPSYLVLYLTVRNVLILLCDHLPSDSGFHVRVTGLLSIFFDLISYHASKIFVALGQIKIGEKNKFPLVLWLKLHSWLFSQYGLHFEIYQGTNFRLILLSFCSKVLRSKIRNRKSKFQDNPNYIKI